MADAFRGLTIRLGADARPLNSALSSISRSASAAQKQLRMIQSTIKAGGADARVFGSAFDLASDKAKLTARSLSLTETAIRNSKNEIVQFSKQSGIASAKLGDLAKDASKVYSATQRLTEQRTVANKQLQMIWDKVAQVYAEAKKLDVKSEQVNTHIAALKRNMSGTGEAAKRARKEVESLVRSASRKTDIAERFGLTRAFGDASRLWSVFTKLRKESSALQMDLQAMERVEGLRAAQYKAQALSAELKQAALEAVRFRSEMHAANAGSGLAKAKGDAERLANELRIVSQEAEEARAASKALPSNMHAAANAARATKAQHQLLAESARKYEEILEKIRANPAFDIQKARTIDAATVLSRAENNAAEFRIKIEKAEKAVERLEDELRKVDKVPLSVAGNRAEVLRQRIAQAKDAIDRFRLAYEKADNEVEKAAMYREFQKAENALNKLNAQAAELKTRLSIASAAMAAFRNIRTMGYGLYSTITPAIMIGGRYAIQAAEEIDAAYRDMRKTVNGTEEQFEHLKDAALEFSRTHVTSADQMLEIEAIGGQLGIAVENLEGFGEVVSNLDIATNMDAETIATNIGQLSNIMWDIKQHKNDPVEYQKAITSFSDSLVRLGNNSAAQEGNIMKVMMRIASLGSISGMATPDLLAISTAVAATGQGAEAAGTAISRTFAQIESAVAGGGDDLLAWAKAAGMDAETFATTWKTKPTEAFRAFVEGLKNTKETGGSVVTTLEDLKIGSVRQRQALMGLTETYDVLVESLGMSNDAWNGESTLINGAYEQAGDAAREASRKAEGFSGALAMMKNNARFLAVELAEGAAPMIADLGNLFYSFTEMLKTMSPEMKTFAIQALGIVAAIGPASIAIGAMGTSMSAIFGFLGRNMGKLVPFAGRMQGIAKAGIAAGSGLGKFSAAIGGLTWGKLAIGAVAIGALVTAIQFAVTKYNEFHDATDRAASIAIDSAPHVYKVADGFGTLGKNVQSTYKPISEFIEQQAQVIRGIESRNKSAQEELASLEEAKNVLRNQMNQTNDTADAQGRLIAAVDLVNEKCGTQYKVVDALNGKIADEQGQLQNSIGAIKDYITAKEDQIRVEAYEADLMDLRAQKRVALDQLTRAQEKLNAAIKVGGGTEEDAWATNYDMMLQATQEYDLALSALEPLNEGIKTYEALIGDAAKGTVLLSDSWEAAFGDVTAFGSFQQSMQDMGVSLEWLNNQTDEKIAAAVAAWKSGGSTISDIISMLGADARGYAATLTESMANGQVSFETFASTFGLSMDDMASALLTNGISLETMSRIGQTELEQLSNAAGTDISELIRWLLNLQNTPAEVNVEANTSSVDQAVDQTQQDIANVDQAEGTATIDADATQEQQEMSDAEDDLTQYDNATATATAALDTSSADTALSNLISRLQNYANSTYTATVSANTSGGNAAGGVWNRTISAVPRHAAGSINGIVTGPTMTNVGLTGEAGDEAIIHMRHAGGAIIPLSNRQHVRPFAHAVASEMGGGFGGTTTVYNISLNDFAINDDAEIRTITRDYISTLNRKAAMQVG